MKLKKQNYNVNYDNKTKNKGVCSTNKFDYKNKKCSKIMHVYKPKCKYKKEKLLLFLNGQHGPGN